MRPKFRFQVAHTVASAGGGPFLNFFIEVRHGAFRRNFRSLHWRHGHGIQPRPIKHAHIGFRVAPGGPLSRRRAAPPGLPASRGWGRPGGTLGGPAVGDSGPPHGPDRRAPKQANISSLTGLYTAFQSAPPRALRHGLHLGIPDVESTLRQLRRAWFRPAESLQGSFCSPIGIDAAGKSTKHDDAANLVTQA